MPGTGSCPSAQVTASGVCTDLAMLHELASQDDAQPASARGTYAHWLNGPRTKGRAKIWCCTANHRGPQLHKLTTRNNNTEPALSSANLAAHTTGLPLLCNTQQGAVQ